jgi:ABC-type enterochelin transport system permease subunit
VDTIMLVALVILVSLTVALVVPPVFLALVARVISTPQKACRRPSSRRLIGALRRQSL